MHLLAMSEQRDVKLVWPKIVNMKSRFFYCQSRVTSRISYQGTVDINFIIKLETRNVECCTIVVIRLKTPTLGVVFSVRTELCPERETMCTNKFELSFFSVKR